MNSKGCVVVCVVCGVATVLRRILPLALVPVIALVRALVLDLAPAQEKTMNINRDNINNNNAKTNHNNNNHQRKTIIRRRIIIIRQCLCS